MEKDTISFILNSENRKKIVKILFEYPKRQWSCSSIEEFTKISHATVFRTLQGLKDFGILKSIKINRKDIIYEFVDSPFSKEIRKMLNIEKTAMRKIGRDFINKIKSKEIYSAILYGSSIKGEIKPESDIDILIILHKHDSILESRIFDFASKSSSKLNKTISPVIMDRKEIKKEKKGQFIRSVKQNMEVIHG